MSYGSLSRRKKGRIDEIHLFELYGARASFERALTLTSHELQRRFLQERLSELG
jgi:predicted RNA polymerase sigma factor